MTAERTLEWDWHTGAVPENVIVDESAYIETAFSFHLYRSRLPGGVQYGPGAASYLGTMFDVGPQGRVKLGECAMVHGARIICDAEITIGDYALISWNVVLMDTYRLPQNITARRKELELACTREMRVPCGGVSAKPIRIERNVWIGFDACVLPGVTIGEGSVVGARSVVTKDVPAYTVVGGNPARVVRQLEPGRHRSDCVS